MQVIKALMILSTGAALNYVSLYSKQVYYIVEYTAKPPMSIPKTHDPIPLIESLHWGVRLVCFPLPKP